MRHDTPTHEKTREGILWMRGRVMVRAGTPTHEKTKERILRMRGRVRLRAGTPTHEKTKECISEMRKYKFNLWSHVFLESHKLYM